jgi:L-ascorbate metabolism protein UlaG (beta-lactamase superfamily)
MRDSSYWPVDFLKEAESNRPQTGIVLWSLGSPSFLFQSPRCTIYIDPYFGPTPSEAKTLYPGIYRTTAVPIYPPEISQADVVLSTHDHPDHCHEPTLLAFQSHTKALFLCPETSSRRMQEGGIELHRITTVNPGDDLDIQDVHIEVFNSHDPDAPGAVTFLLRADGVTLFVSGDTRDGETLSKIGRENRIDLGLLAFGSKRWYMNNEQMLAAARHLNPRVLLPFHWELWRGETGDLLDLGKMLATHPPPFEVRLLQIGDCLRYEPQLRPG